MALVYSSTSPDRRYDEWRADQDNPINDPPIETLENLDPFYDPEEHRLPE